jgi:hypothetical protein
MTQRNQNSTYDEYHRQYYLKHKQEILEYNKQTRQLRIRLHLCRECGKQDAYTLNGRTRCADCVAKDTERLREKRGYRPAWERQQKPTPEINRPRGDNGICWQCNKLPVMDGRHLCQSCYDRKVDVLRKNDFWRGRRKEGHPWTESLR